MEIHKFAKKTFWSLLLVGMMICCVSEDDYPNQKKKPVEPLTVESARSLYQQYVGTTASLKSAGEDSGVELLPDWNAGQLFSDSLWYVVESPLETLDGSIRFMTPELEEYCEANNARPLQVLRQVVMRNKETGLDYAFTMVIMPGLDYMLKKGDELGQNYYLSRSSDLSGTVIFYTTAGEFVNGWVYENGKITHSIGESNNRLKAMVVDTRCWTQHFYAIDRVTGEEKYLGSTTYCDTEYKFVDWLDDGDGSGGGGVGPSLPPIGDGSGGGSNTDKDKEPEKRTDCDEKAEQNAKDAKNAMEGNTDIKDKINTLRDYAKNKTNEYGMLIDSRGSSYQGSNIIEGKNGEITYQYSPYTAYDVHTHDKTGGFSGHAGYTGFSVLDIYSTFEANQFYYDYYNGSSSNPYKGSIVIAYDGSEYILSVNDAKKARDYFIKNGNMFQANDENMFNDSKMMNEYKTIKDGLLNNKYSQQDAHDYALTHLLDKYDTGLKMSKKESGKSDFKEMKTEKVNNNYQPKKCP